MHFSPKIRKKIDSVLLKNRLFFSLLHGKNGVFFRVRPNEFSYSMGQKGKKSSRKVKRCCSQHFSGYDIFFHHHSKGSTIKKLKHVLWGERMTPLLIVLMSYEDWRYAFSGILIIENHNWNNHNDHHAQWWNIFFCIIIKENDTSLYWWWFFIEKIPEINKKIDKNQSNYR